MVNGVKVAKQQSIASLHGTTNSKERTINQTFGTQYKSKKPSLGGDDINDLKIKNDLSNLPSVKGNEIDGV